MTDTRSIDELAAGHLEGLMELYADEWWTSTRTRADVESMLASTAIVRGIVDAEDTLVAFARITGDLVYDANLLDVIVRSDRRGRGLGDLVMADVLDDPRLAGLRGGIVLRCRVDKAPFYERWGFERRLELPRDGRRDPWRDDVPDRDLRHAAMTSRVHDPRQRYSYELRPDAALDAAIRDLAQVLEDDGLLPSGAATAPRFHPHLTFLRADHADAAVVDALANRLAHDPAIGLDVTGVFGSGRIAWFGFERATLLHATRAWLVDALGGDAHVDPLALRREPWIPHMTVAYEVAEQHRGAVADRLRAATPLTGSWSVAQTWDLDVRPTVLQHEARIDRR